MANSRISHLFDQDTVLSYDEHTAERREDLDQLIDSLWDVNDDPAYQGAEDRDPWEFVEEDEEDDLADELRFFALVDQLVGDRDTLAYLEN